MDRNEKGVTTILKPKEICTSRVTKHVCDMVTAERETLVTIEIAISQNLFLKTHYN